MNLSRQQLILFLRLSRPHFLVGGIMLYGLGVAIARYLGRPFLPAAYWTGQVLVTSIQLMAHYLNEYFDAPADSTNSNRTLFNGGSGALGQDGLSPKVALYSAAFSMAITAIAASAGLVNGILPPLAWVILGMAFLASFAYSTPPLRLVSSGYGEIIASLIVSALVPAFAFALQTGELHRLLLLTCTPLVAVNFAMLIAFELPDFASDTKFEKQTLMVRLGWLSAMRIHDGALVFALLSLVAANFIFNLPHRVGLGSLLFTPLAVAQIWQMNRIRNGFAPNWLLLTGGALVAFGLLIYLDLVGYLLS